MSDVRKLQVAVDNEKDDAAYVTELLERTLADIREGTLKPLDVAVILVERLGDGVKYVRRTTANVGSELNLYQLAAYNTCKEIMDD